MYNILKKASLYGLYLAVLNLILWPLAQAGTRQFAPEPIRVPIEGYAKDLQVVDLNGDGLADLVTLHWEEGHRASIQQLDPPNGEIAMSQAGLAVVRLADPANLGSFLPAEYISFGSFIMRPQRGFSSWLNVADMNNDGFPDLLLLNTASFNVTIAHNDGTGHFPVANRVLVGVSSRKIWLTALDENVFPVEALLISPGDFDQDGKKDFAVTYGYRFTIEGHEDGAAPPLFIEVGIASFLQDNSGNYLAGDANLLSSTVDRKLLSLGYQHYTNFYTVGAPGHKGRSQREYYQLFAAPWPNAKFSKGFPQIIFRSSHLNIAADQIFYTLSIWDPKNNAYARMNNANIEGAINLSGRTSILGNIPPEKSEIELLCGDGGAITATAPDFSPITRGAAGAACGFGDFDRDGAIDLYQIQGNDLSVQYGNLLKPDDFTFAPARLWSSPGTVVLPWHENPLIARTGNFNGDRVNRKADGLPYEDIAILGTNQIQIYYNVGDNQPFALALGDIMPGIGAFPGDIVTLTGAFAVGVPAAELVSITLDNGKGTQISISRKDIQLTKGATPGSDTAAFTMPNLDPDTYQLKVQNLMYSTTPRPYLVFSKAGMTVTILDLNPKQARYGGRVDVSGNAFAWMSAAEVSEIIITGSGATAGKGFKLTKGSGEGKFDFLNANTLVMQLPFYARYAWLPGNYSVSLKTLDGKISNLVPLSLIPDRPIVTSITNPKMLGQEVTIQGQGFNIGAANKIFAIRLTNTLMMSIQYSEGAGKGSFRFSGNDIILTLPDAGGLVTTGMYKVQLIDGDGRTSDLVDLTIN